MLGDPRKIILKSSLQDHAQDWRAEFGHYKNTQANSKKGHFIRFVFDFAEKVLLPKLMKQPGQLHFITGLKFDFFAVKLQQH